MFVTQCPERTHAGFPSLSFCILAIGPKAHPLWSCHLLPYGAAFAVIDKVADSAPL